MKSILLAAAVAFFGISEAALSQEIVVDYAKRTLTFTDASGRSSVYSVGVGRAGFAFKGVERISRKTEWPDWTPPAEMIRRQPYLPRFMAGGEGNPLGARAMYLGSTVYRIHGSNQPPTIGTAVSSGCIRMRNDDIIELYPKVPVGTKVTIR